MYLQTLSTSDFETENADAESCHLNRVAHKLFSFMNLSELSAIDVNNDSSDVFGERDATKWTCSALAYIAYNFESLLLTMPVIYFSIRSLFYFAQQMIFLLYDQGMLH